MTKKQKTILAVKKLIERYESGDPEMITLLGDSDSCPLCTIHFDKKPEYSNCKGCPMASISGGMSCMYFFNISVDGIAALEVKLEMAANKPIHTNSLNAGLRWAQRRADAYKKVLAVIERWPEKRFTREGWRYVDWDEKFGY